MALLGIAAFGAAAILGAPFLPTLPSDHQVLLDLADLKAGDQLLDLGSGSGGLLVAAAKRGIKASGIELNPLLWFYSTLRTWPWHRLVRVRLGNYWQLDWGTPDCIYVFLITNFMPKLDRQLTKRLTKPTKVVSYVYKIPGRAPLKQTRNAELYLYEQRVNHNY